MDNTFKADKLASGTLDSTRILSQVYFGVVIIQIMHTTVIVTRVSVEIIASSIYQSRRARRTRSNTKVMQTN